MEIIFRALLCLAVIYIALALPTINEGDLESAAAASLSSSTSTSTSSSSAPSIKSDTFASDASQLIALNLLKSNIDIDGNQVHSPLGVSSILAVLAEAANGETYEEFHKVFSYPKEREGLRSSFKRILGKYHNREYAADPSFQTWLYIYRNYSARDEYKKLLRDNYLVEVKDINRDDYDWSEPNTSLDLGTGDSASGSTTLPSNSKDVIGFETLKRLPVDDGDAVDIATIQQLEQKDSYGVEILDKAASKFDRVVDDKQYVEKPVILAEIENQKKQKQEKLEESSITLEQQKEEKLSADAAKEPSTLTIKEKPALDLEMKELVAEKLENLDKKLAEIETEPEISKLQPVIQKEQNQQQELQEEKISQDSLKPLEETPVLGEKNKREDDLNLIENETVQVDEKLQKSEDFKKNSVIPIKDVLDSNEPEKVSIPIDKLESAIDDTVSKDAGEIMIALESHIRSVRRAFGARSLFQKDDIASALSANSITGRDVGSKTKMLLFNGLYYRGNWAYPFAMRAPENGFFFMDPEVAVEVPMMHARGKYCTVDLEHLKAKLILLPYENKKYGMAIVLPNEIEGLRGVIEKLDKKDFAMAGSKLAEKELHVVMPRFQAEETSRSEAVLKNMGLKKLFSREEADLSLLSEDPDLHIDEIVQFVSVRVDEGGSGKNALSATQGQGRTSEKPEIEDLETFLIDRPFLYFVMDLEEDFVIASGKIYTPDYTEEKPVTIEVEYEKP